MEDQEKYRTEFDKLMERSHEVWKEAMYHREQATQCALGCQKEEWRKHITAFKEKTAEWSQIMEDVCLQYERRTYPKG